MSVFGMFDPDAFSARSLVSPTADGRLRLSWSRVGGRWEAISALGARRMTTSFSLVCGWTWAEFYVGVGLGALGRPVGSADARTPCDTAPAERETCRVMWCVVCAATRSRQMPDLHHLRERIRGRDAVRNVSLTSRTLESCSALLQEPLRLGHINHMRRVQLSSRSLR